MGLQMKFRSNKKDLQEFFVQVNNKISPNTPFFIAYWMRVELSSIELMSMYQFLSGAFDEIAT